MGFSTNPKEVFKKFNHRFSRSYKITSFSHDSEEILSKSPYLPHNTLVSSSKSFEKNTHFFYRVAYLDKEAIDSWISVLEKLDNEMITISSPIFHILEKLSKVSNKNINLICDIEKFSTTVYLEIKNRELFNTKLPYGASLYSSKNTVKSQYDMFFNRLKSSVIQILKNNKISGEYEVFVTGVGLNMLINNREILKNEFKRLPEILTRKYSFSDNSLKGLENNNLFLFEMFSSYYEEEIK